MTIPMRHCTAIFIPFITIHTTPMIYTILTHSTVSNREHLPQRPVLCLLTTITEIKIFANHALESSSCNESPTIFTFTKPPVKTNHFSCKHCHCLLELFLMQEISQYRSICMISVQFFVLFFNSKQTYTTRQFCFVFMYVSLAEEFRVIFMELSYIFCILSILCSTAPYIPCKLSNATHVCFPN